MANQRKIRVGILFGGQSTEHEISILSARNVLAALDRSRFEPVPIGIDKTGQWVTQDSQRLLASASDPRLVHLDAGKQVRALSRITVGNASAPGDACPIDVVFPVLHGPLGEDGTIQGLLELARIPYVGAGVIGAALGMDKDVSKRLLRDANIPVAEFRTVRRKQFDANPRRTCDEVAALSFPMFVKPANAGSSVGVRKVVQPEALEDAIRFAFEFDGKVIVEAMVTGREIELGVLDGDPPIVSHAGEIIVEHPDGFYSYDAKYVDERGARLEIPARIAPGEQHRAQALALRTFDVLECEGLARVDLFLTAEGKMLVNEINTMPGFTAISMYPKLWQAAGVSSTELVSRLIELALRRDQARGGIRRSVR